MDPGLGELLENKQGGDTKKNKDITLKFFLRNNLVD